MYDLYDYFKRWVRGHRHYKNLSRDQQNKIIAYYYYKDKGYIKNENLCRKTLQS